jgi:glutaredoxin
MASLSVRARLFIASGFAGVLLFGLSVARGDTVVLKNGKTYTGKIKPSEKTDVLIIRSEGIDWTVPVGQIATQEQNEEGVEEAGIIQSAKPAPPPAKVADAKEKKGKQGQKGRKGKGPLPMVTLYTEKECKHCVELIRLMNLNNSLLSFEVRELTAGADKSDVCARAKAQNVKCDPLPIVELDGKFYTGMDMNHICVGMFGSIGK